MKGVYRCVIEDVGSWRLVIDDGKYAVSESDESADLVLKSTEEVFLRVIRGEQNAVTAMLTGTFKLDGDLTLAPNLGKFFSPALKSD